MIEYCINKGIARPDGLGMDAYWSLEEYVADNAYLPAYDAIVMED